MKTAKVSNRWSWFQWLLCSAGRREDSRVECIITGVGSIMCLVMVDFETRQYLRVSSLVLWGLLSREAMVPGIGGETTSRESGALQSLFGKEVPRIRSIAPEISGIWTHCSSIYSKWMFCMIIVCWMPSKNRCPRISKCIFLPSNSSSQDDLPVQLCVQCVIMYRLGLK